LVNVGTKYETSVQAVSLAKKYKEGVYAIVGLHPIHTIASYHDEAELGENATSFTSAGEVFDDKMYFDLASHPKVIGIGECGLDYFRIDESTKNIQQEVFSKQIVLANKLHKPLMLHTRSSEDSNAYLDVISMLKNEARVPGNVHFFAGTTAEAKVFLDLGFYLSFTGVVTFAKAYEELVKFVPLDRLLVETDCPYVAPVPKRGKRNEPAFVKHVAEKIAVIKNLSTDEVASQTTKNWFKLFGSGLD